jgi:hypothetical protein
MPQKMSKKCPKKCLILGSVWQGSAFSVPDLKLKSKNYFFFKYTQNDNKYSLDNSTSINEGLKTLHPGSI